MVRAEASTIAVGNRHLAVHADEFQRVSITGVASVGECIEFYMETWEARSTLLRNESIWRSSHKTQDLLKDGIRVAESIIGAMKRVTIGEQRVGR